jgi:hypothetical protein
VGRLDRQGAIQFDPTELDCHTKIAVLQPAKHIWWVHEKDKQAGLGDTEVRQHMRVWRS